MVELDDFRFDLRLIITLPAINLNPLNIALRASRGVKPGCFELGLFRQRIRGDVLGSLKNHVADELSFCDLDDDSAPFAPDVNIPEKSGREERLDAFVRLAGVVTLPGVQGQVMRDGFGLDALIARHPYLRDDGPALRIRIFRQRRRYKENG